MHTHIKLGDRGPRVSEIRNLLGQQGILITGHTTTTIDPRQQHTSLTDRTHNADDLYDEHLFRAVCTFQQMRGLLVDGIVGNATYRSLHESKFSLGARDLFYHPADPLTGDDVLALQARLQKLGFYTESIDGIFGILTHQGLSDYQRESGLTPDGVCGRETIRSLNLLGLNIGTTSAHAVKEFERTRDLGPYLAGKIITIDPGSTPHDRKQIVLTDEGPFSYTDLLWDIALKTAQQLSLLGVTVELSRNEFEDSTDARRAHTANNKDSHLAISLRFASYPNSKAHGVASFYYGNRINSYSPLGKRLAMYLQKEICARTPLLDCRYHERTWEILRLTKMPSVLIDLAYMTNPDDSLIICQSGYRKAIADAIVISVKRLFQLGNNEQPTGTYNFDALLRDETINKYSQSHQH